jgi:hypothetical protein
MTTYKKGALVTIADPQRVVLRAYRQHDDAEDPLRRSSR